MIDWIIRQIKNRDESVKYSNLEKLEELTDKLDKRDESIKRAKQQWENTFDVVPDLITILDSDWKIIRANKAMADRLGVDVRDLPGKNCFNLLHRENKPLKSCPHYRTIKDKKIHITEEYNDILKGYFITSTSPLVMDNEIVGTVHVMREITERRIFEHKLASMTRFFQKTIDELPCFVCVLDEEANVKFLDKKWREEINFLGYQISVGDNFLNFLKNQNRNEALPIIAGLHTVLSGNSNVFYDEYVIEDSEVWYNFHISKFFSTDKYYILICQQDISRRVMAEKIKEEKCNFLNNILDLIDEYVIIIKNKKIIYYNRKCEDESKINRSFFINKNIDEFFDESNFDCSLFNIKNKNIEWRKTTFYENKEEYLICLGKEI